MNNHKTIVTHAGIQSAIKYLCDGDDRITAAMIGSTGRSLLQINGLNLYRSY